MTSNPERKEKRKLTERLSTEQKSEATLVHGESPFAGHSVIDTMPSETAHTSSTVSSIGDERTVSRLVRGG